MTIKSSQGEKTTWTVVPNKFKDWYHKMIKIFATLAQCLKAFSHLSNRYST